MRSTLLVLLIAVSMLPLSNLLFSPATGSNIVIETTRFANGKPEVTVEFLGGGIDDTMGLSLQTGAYVEDVRMKVSSVAQPPGSKEYPSNIGIDFGGDKALEWAWNGPGYGPLGRQTMFVNNKPIMNASITMGGGYNDTAAIRLPKTAVVKSATMNVSAGSSIGAQGAVLVLNACNSYYGWQTDAQTRLKQFTNDFSQVDRYDAYSNTPTWDDIKGYSAILTFSDWNYGYGYKDAAALGNLLADYVDAGGSLVCAFSSHYNGYGSFDLEGRFASEKYYVMNPNGNIYYATSGIGNIMVPDHPIMSNVSSISFSYYGYTYRSNAGVDADATIISKWGDGFVLAAVKNVGGVDRVDINMWPVSQYVSYPYMAYYGDGDDLLKNALLFGGRKPIDAKIDILNDAVIDLNRTGFTGNYTFPDFASSLNAYIGAANVSYSDKYGNQFVDVPINATSPGGGRLAFGNLAITYDYSTQVVNNPATGNLTLAVSDLQSTILGPQNNIIPMYISSTSSGEIKLSDLYVRMTPPAHSPRVDSFFPALKTTVEEASTLELGVNATDIYKNPMTYAWFYNGEPIVGATSNRLSHDFGYEDAGEHTIVVKIANGISEKTYTNVTWQIVVRDLNRPPEITSILPTTDVSIAENSTLLFRVVVADPDVGDLAAYSWYLDGKKVDASTGDNYTYAPGFFESGTHTVKVNVADRMGASDTRNWKVTVTDVNLVPMLSDWSPKENPRISETQSQRFSLTATDPDKDDRVTVSWFVDNAQVFVGNQFTFVTDYKSAGVHTVKASATDGEDTATYTWTVTVDNLNRLPTAAVATPADLAEFMEGDSIKFSARSSSDPDNDTLAYTWKEGGVNVSDQMDFERSFAPGIHTLTLEVRDQPGGKSSATVRFRVRYVELSVVVGMDRLDIQAGNKVEIILTMSNVGDANATEVPVDIMIDGKSIGTTTIKDLRPGGAEKGVFQWKATRGTHTITAKVGDKTWTKEVTVAAAPPPPPSAGIADYLWPILLVVMAVGLIGFGAMVLRKK